MARHARLHSSRCRRLSHAQWLPAGDDLLRNGDVRIGRRETAGTIQQTVRNTDRRNKDPICPGLRHHRVRLHAIDNVLPPLRGLLNLIRRCCIPDGLIDRSEFFLQLFVLLFQSNQLRTSVFVLPKGNNRSCHLIGIHLCKEIHFHNHNIAVQGCSDLLIEHEHQPGGVGADFISRDIHIAHDCDAFKIGRDLLERVSLGRLGGDPNGVLTGIVIPHSVLTLGIDDPDVSECGVSGYEHREREKQDNESIRFIRQQADRKRPLMENLTEHRLPLLTPGHR